MNAALPTVGVEEEFLLADPASGAPAPRNVEVAAAAAEVGIDLQLELTRCQIETNTEVHTKTSELLDDLRRLRTGVASCAEKHGARLLAVGVPPAVQDEFPVTDTPRYQRIERNFGMLAHEQGLCGCHVHVGVPARDVAVRVGNYLRPWLPVLLSLTANSPVYRATDTGYASWRSIMWRRWPSAGPPPFFASIADYDDMVEMMLASGSILDTAMVYWDVRPSASFPTVEVRVSDVPATVEETALLATLIRAAVAMALEERRPAPPVPAEVLRAAYWKAARSGLDGDGLDTRTGRTVPARILLDQLIDYVTPALEQSGDQEFVAAAVAAVAARGNGARRQRAALRAHNDVTEVIDELAAATLEGCY
ncbi:glutamate--cysteine ligase [Nocardia sp. NBC_00565]|uniref:carboxylate-amine ligase n=1 Tax=Nocardia sp. NBC_00565 TaxID=2975993 RepID=UPI002E822F72|nr:glutamate--cysteine ligase [Nocardia sp. NBC_00565]WUC06227.1 glutamate--cysteine ligase [Nocardia sp. NBC_00565]